MQRIAMGWFVYRLTHSAFLLGVVGFTGQIPIFLLTPFAVAWLERGKKIKSYRWVILCSVYLSILAFALTLQSIPPILPLIISELHITYAQSGLLMGFFALPGLFVSLLGGFLSDRYRMRPLGIACFSFMIGGTLCVGLGMNLWILWLGRIISGIGALTLSTILPKLLSQWFREREEGLAMGIFNTGIPLGSIICFSLFGRMEVYGDGVSPSC
jgi:MFS family permease